jgi:signal transduction histidine kinase
LPPDSQAPSTTEPASLQELLRFWEARGLRWTVIGRLALITAGAATLPVLSGNSANTVYTALLLLIGIALSVYSLMLLRKRQKLGFVGYAGLAFDLFIICTLPISWYSAVGGEAIQRVYMLKNELILLCLIYIVINSLANRPVYPLVMTAGSIVLHLALLFYVLADPRLVISVDLPSSVLGSTLHPGLFAWQIITLVLVGGSLSLLAHLSHRTIRAGVELEHAHQQIREKQAELVMQGKIAAVASLVAGIAHEVNTPLGVVMSSLTTAESCAEKISMEMPAIETPPAAPAPRLKAFVLLKENIHILREAAHRISGLVSKLKDFVGLDQAEVQDADLEAGIDRALSLLPPELKQHVTIVKEFGHPPPVRCRPKEIYQVMMTLMRNACEAMEGSGTLRVRTAALDSRVTMEFADTGKGMSPEQLQWLFDMRFATKDGRVAMGFGLPLARTIIDRHGGSISAESGVGSGTVIRISLPLRATIEDKS